MIWEWVSECISRNATPALRFATPTLLYSYASHSMEQRIYFSMLDLYFSSLCYFSILDLCAILNVSSRRVFCILYSVLALSVESPSSVDQSINQSPMRIDWLSVLRILVAGSLPWLRYRGPPCWFSSTLKLLQYHLSSIDLRLPSPDVFFILSLARTRRSSLRRASSMVYMSGLVLENCWPAWACTSTSTVTATATVTDTDSSLPGPVRWASWTGSRLQAWGSVFRHPPRS